MDGSAFDRLARAFGAAGSSRRRILALISGLSLAGLVAHGERQAEAVDSLREHTVFITLFAIGLGLFLARLLSNSIANRVHNITSE